MQNQPQSTSAIARFGWSRVLEPSIVLLTLGANIYCFTELPYYCMRYGACECEGSVIKAYHSPTVTFWLPCLVTLLLVVIPVYYYQLAMGQYSGQTAITFWRCVPLMQGESTCDEPFYTILRFFRPRLHVRVLDDPDPALLWHVLRLVTSLPLHRALLESAVDGAVQWDDGR